MYLLYVMGGFICNISLLYAKDLLILCKILSTAIYLVYVMGGFMCNISLL
jgi:hypothetical protein